MARSLLFLALSVAVSALPPALPVSPLNGLESRSNACDAIKYVVDIIRPERDAAPFCSSVLHITPSTLVITATSTPPPVVATTTVVVNQINTRTVQVTQTALSTTTVFPVAKRANPSLTALQGIASSLISKGCSCLSLPTSTVTSTTTVAGAAQTSTAVQSVTSTTVVDQTVTNIQTSVVTVTAAATCGKNLVVNGDFPEPNYSPFVESSTGNAAPQLNAGCGLDPYCPLFIVNNGGGSETLTQTIATFPGQTYTLSYNYNNFGASAGSTLACSVDVPGSSPVSANLGTITGARFVLASGTFKATGTSTVLTCKASTSGNMASNIQAIHIMC